MITACLLSTWKSRQYRSQTKSPKSEMWCTSWFLGYSNLGPEHKVFGSHMTTTLYDQLLEFDKRLNKTIGLIYVYIVNNYYLQRKLIIRVTTTVDDMPN